MLPDLVVALACPLDGGRLRLEGRALACDANHRFDLARQGYATLTATPLAHGGDTATMLDSRSRVHAAGVLGAVHDAVVAALTDALAGALPDGIVCDVGTGTGAYLADALDALPGRVGLGVDVSKASARRVARCHPRGGAVVADVWRGLPLRDGAVAVLLDVFAPRNPQEFARVVAPEGLLVVVTPDPDHLAGLREQVGMLAVPPGKASQVARELAPAFVPAGRVSVRQPVSVPAELAVDLASMGPSGYHLDAADLATLLAAPPGGQASAASAAGAAGTAGKADTAAGAPTTPLTVTIAATVSGFRRR